MSLLWRQPMSCTLCAKVSLSLVIASSVFLLVVFILFFLSLSHLLPSQVFLISICTQKPLWNVR